MNKIKKTLTAKFLDINQRLIKIAYAREGATDFIIKRQVNLNKKRHELDIPDKDELVFEDYVQ